jgi:mono/diheme cytochrome c family protein
MRSPVRSSCAALVAVAVAVVVLAACGGGHTHALVTKQPRGEQLFVQSCGSCHKLDAAGTEGVVGKNLDETRPTRALVLRTLAAPPKNMPANLLSGRDAQAVAAYVAAVAGR